jgi:hypothetical protein
MDYQPNETIWYHATPQSATTTTQLIIDQLARDLDDTEIALQGYRETLYASLEECHRLRAELASVRRLAAILRPRVRQSTVL